MGPVLVEAFRYNKWANLYVLDVCAGLTEEQLDLTAPGTFGTIAATLSHLLGAEQRYVWRFEGEKPQFNEDEGFPGIAALKEHAARSGDQLIAKAGELKDVADAGPTRLREDELRAPLAMILVQALHHGNDHRTHVCAILGMHGVPYGDMDVWSYAQSIGEYVQKPESA